MHLMRESSSVIDLELRLKEDSGLEFSDWKEYITWLKSAWSQISAERIHSVLETIPTETTFPTLTVESEGVEYQLHGILHGYPIYLAPGWHTRRCVREFVRDTARTFHRPLDGEDYLYEENLRLPFDLLRSQELIHPTHTNGKLKWGGIGTTAHCMLSVVAEVIEWGVGYVYSTTIRNPKDQVGKCIRLYQKALTDKRYQAQFADLCIAEEMPQPFNLEMSYLSQKEPATKPLGYPAIDPNDPTAVEDSLWTAGELRDYAQRRGLKKLHHINGTDHTTEIAYFLHNPDFSFERLEEYRMGRKQIPNSFL